MLPVSPPAWIGSEPRHEKWERGQQAYILFWQHNILVGSVENWALGKLAQNEDD